MTSGGLEDGGRKFVLVEALAGFPPPDGVTPAKGQSSANVQQALAGDAESEVAASDADAALKAGITTVANAMALIASGDFLEGRDLLLFACELYVVA